MNKKLVAALLSTVVGQSAFAQVTPEQQEILSLLAQAVNQPAMLTPQELEQVGLHVPILKNESGQVRKALPNETVKVTVHDEIGEIDFSSFDNFSRRLPIGDVHQPRNGLAGDAKVRN